MIRLRDSHWKLPD